MVMIMRLRRTSRLEVVVLMVVITRLEVVVVMVAISRFKVVDKLV